MEVISDMDHRLDVVYLAVIIIWHIHYRIGECALLSSFYTGTIDPRVIAFRYSQFRKADFL